MSISTNFTQKTNRSSSSYISETQPTSLLQTYKLYEYQELLALLEKSMLFLNNDDKSLLRNCLKHRDLTLEFLLLRYKNINDKGCISLEIKKFLKTLKTPKKPLKPLENHFESAKNPPLTKTPNTPSISQKNRNTSIFAKKLPRKTSAHQISTPKNSNKFTNFSSNRTEITLESLSTKENYPIFSQGRHIKSSNPNNILKSSINVSNFVIMKKNDENINKYTEENSDFLTKLSKICKIDTNFEGIFMELFSEKGLYKISNAYFRYKLSNYIRTDGYFNKEEEIDEFLDELFKLFDLKHDGLLDINELGKFFEKSHFSTFLKNPSNLHKLWLKLDPSGKGCISKREVSIKLTEKPKLLQVLISCDRENKGFLTYWDLWLREMQEKDILVLARECFDLIG